MTIDKPACGNPGYFHPCARNHRSDAMKQTPASVSNGLSSAEAAARLLQYGPNLLRPALRRALALQFLAHFRNPLVLMLLAASGISALTGDVTGALIIGVIVLMSVTLDFVQAYRAGQRRRAAGAEGGGHAPPCCATASPREVPVAELVPGDVVLLSAGDLVPADAELLEARRFFRQPGAAHRRALSGGKTRVAARRPRQPRRDWALEAADAVFMGSSVVSGSARVLIGRTGSATALGQIAVSLARAGAAHRVRDRHPPFRPAHHAPDRAAGAVHLAGQCGLAPLRCWSRFCLPWRWRWA